MLTKGKSAVLAENEKRHVRHLLLLEINIVAFLKIQSKSVEIFNSLPDRRQGKNHTCLEIGATLLCHNHSGIVGAVICIMFLLTGKNIDPSLVAKRQYNITRLSDSPFTWEVWTQFFYRLYIFYYRFLQYIFKKYIFYRFFRTSRMINPLLFKYSFIHNAYKYINAISSLGTQMNKHIGLTLQHGNLCPFMT